MPDGPPWSRAITGRPDAIASSTTRPNVSDIDECRKTSALAYARANSAPCRRPENVTRSDGSEANSALMESTTAGRVVTTYDVQSGRGRVRAMEGVGDVGQEIEALLG